MKFELSPDNRDQPDAVLLDDLKAASAAANGRKLSKQLYAGVGRFHPSTIAARFGGWGKALQLAGLTPPRHFDVAMADAIADLRRVASTLGLRTVSIVDYSEHGRYSTTPILRQFGSWNEALRASGLEVSDHFHRKATTEELFTNLERVWRELGRQPTVNDMFPPGSEYSAHAYKRSFGGWRKALEAFVATSHELIGGDHPAVNGESTDTSSKSLQPREPSPSSPVKVRSVGWRLRWVVMQRDGFRCRACGRSPATHPNTVLHVDHIEAWSRGGATEESNLQTLCEKCNIGKGAG